MNVINKFSELSSVVNELFFRFEFYSLLFTDNGTIANDKSELQYFLQEIKKKPSMNSNTLTAIKSTKQSFEFFIPKYYTLITFLWIGFFLSFVG